MAKKFVLSIGDDGSILTLVEKNTVVKRLFAIDASINNIKQMSALLNNNPKCSVSILIDTIDQNFNIQTLPAVSSLSIGKLVNKRLERDFQKSDIKGAVNIGKEESGRKDWIYMFASSPLSQKISSWIDFIISHDNKLEGVFFLPLEMENFLKKINKALDKEKKQSKVNKNYWDMLVTYNKTGGFRQVVMHKQKVIFTRLIRFSNETLPDIVAGNIEQEIINTTDYLRRLNFEDEDIIKVKAIVPNDLKRSLESTVIRNEKISLFAPSEIEELLGISNPLALENKFCDFAIAANFVNDKKILKVQIDKTKKIVLFQNIYKASLVSSALLIIGLIGITTYDFSKIRLMNKKVSKLEDEKAQIEKEWDNVNNDVNGDFEEVTKIADSVEIYRLIKSDNSKLFNMLGNLSDSQESFAYSKSFLWSYSEEIGKKDKGNEKLNLTMRFYNTGASPEDLFRNFDDFINDMSKKFNGYTVKSSKLPEQITFGRNADVINLQINIETDKKGS